VPKIHRSSTWRSSAVIKMVLSVVSKPTFVMRFLLILLLLEPISSCRSCNNVCREFRTDLPDGAKSYCDWDFCTGQPVCPPSYTKYEDWCAAACNIFGCNCDCCPGPKGGCAKCASYQANGNSTCDDLEDTISAPMQSESLERSTYQYMVVVLVV